VNNSYVHHVPGRLRVRAAAVKGSEEKAAAVRVLLQSTTGVRSAAANPLTGSVTIHYDQQITDHLKLMELLDQRGYFVGRPVAAPAMNVSLSRSPKSQVGSMVATTVATFLVEKALEHAILALLTSVL
jgi:hypothetical protein